MAIGVLDPITATRLAVAKLKVEKSKENEAGESPPSTYDLCDWMEGNFYVYRGHDSGLIVLALHQKAILRYALQRIDGDFPFSIIIYSTIKKSGKSTIAGAIAQWFAEVVTQHGSIYCVGNDARQARERSYEFVRQSIAAHPGFLPGKDVLPGQWECLANTLRCLKTGSKIEALAVDSRGEAGGQPALSIWTELWGFETTEALRFWDELTPVPTLPDSIRVVETYAGYDGESELLRNLYDTGMEGRQLTNGELALVAARDKEGEKYEDFLLAFTETGGNPEALVPIWVNENTGQFMYWDSGVVPRRMAWQQGEDGEKYYREREAQEPPKAFQRLHRNEWVGAESEFVPLESWDNCFDPDLQPLYPGDQTPLILGVDAASSGDCFAIVGVTRHPAFHNKPAMRFCHKWTPPRGGRINYDLPEIYIRLLCGGGCANGHPQYEPFRDPNCQACQEGPYILGYNVTQIAYDEYQLESMMQKFSREQLAWCKAFPQGQPRLVADRGLYDKVVRHELAHSGDPDMREHVINANAKYQKDQDSTMRIVKKSSSRKVDLVVALSMAVESCMELVI